MQKDNPAYEWNDMALLVDQRFYTIVCKTMLKLSKCDIQEIQDVALSDWTWQRVSISDDADTALVPFQGIVVLQLYYLDHDFQPSAFSIDIPIQGAWQEALTEQNSMRLIFHHAQTAEEYVLLETVLQINRNQPLDPSQVLIGQFQMDELLTLANPWPSCDTLLAVSVSLHLQDWRIAAQQLQLHGFYQVVCVYQSLQQTGEAVFVYEERFPMHLTVLVPEGLCELSGVMPYYQSITAQLIDETHVQIAGSGVLCTLPIQLDETTPEVRTENEEPHETLDTLPVQKEQPPSVVNHRASRRANLSKYMRHLNNSVETPSSIRNFEISADNDSPD